MENRKYAAAIVFTNTVAFIALIFVRVLLYVNLVESVGTQPECQLCKPCVNRVGQKLRDTEHRSRRIFLKRVAAQQTNFILQKVMYSV